MTMRCLLVFGLGLLVGACNAKKGEEATPASSSETAEPDTGQHRPPVPAPGPAPSTARAVVSFKDCDETPRRYTCLVEVRRVTAYGSSTPLLPSGTQHIVRLAGPVQKADPRNRTLEELVHAEAVEVTLAHQKQMASEEEATDSWTVVELH